GRGWAFRDGPGYTPDPVNGFTLLRQAYEATEPGYDGHVSVPVLWDRRTSRIVSNNFPDVTIDLETQFGAWATPGADLYPSSPRRRCGHRSTSSTSASTPTSTTACTGAGSPPRRRPTTRRWPGCSQRSITWTSGWPRAGTSWGTPSPRPTCGSG